jgi:hypothetical protein
MAAQEFLLCDELKGEYRAKLVAPIVSLPS